MNIGQVSDPGKVRPNNEDCILVDPARGLCIVADGMGGVVGGEVASVTAVEVVSRYIHEHVPAADDSEKVLTLLTDSLLQAHETIHRRTENEKELTGMGTTIVVALFAVQKLYLAHVGDSRAYLVRGNTLRQLTEDHSIVAQIVKKGMISAPEARTHRLRHVLSQAVGTAPSLVPSLQTLELQAGDRLLLCTDGLTDMLSDQELLAGVTAHPADPQAACVELVRRANLKGGRDNISVILAQNP
jgi:protein phosphatase